jgi:hypothetical protein
MGFKKEDQDSGDSNDKISGTARVARGVAR